MVVLARGGVTRLKAGSGQGGGTSGVSGAVNSPDTSGNMEVISPVCCDAADDT